ncbi:MAG: tryptophan--tRNA ligase [Desulfosalsimonas sp.]
MENPGKNPVLLSGIQPTGNLTIANYLGAIRTWVDLQHTHDCLFLLVDLHALTVPQSPETLKDRCYEFACLYLACGLDPEAATVFVQSHVPGHCQLQWMLSCLTRMGELNRMTQFKDKSESRPQEVSAGLYTYPVLMAADILLYNTQVVPVGADQRQHLELTRTLAERFNRRYDPLFTLPRAHLPASGARIMSLTAPRSKMSKTDPNTASYIGLLDPPDRVRKKIRRAVTDPEHKVLRDPARPGLSNLVEIYSAAAGIPVDEIEEMYAGKGYAAFKEDLAAVLIEMLRPIQQYHARLSRDYTYVREIFKTGAAAANQRSQPTLEAVRDALGLIR